MADPQIRAIIRGLDRVSERVVIRITTDVTANLVEDTPRNTGWAAANWVPALGAPRVKDVSSIKTPTPQNVSSAESEQNAALAGVFAYRLGPKVFITNNVPYIGDLNAGKSPKAPPGFVQSAIRKAVTQDIRGFSG